MSNEKHKCIKGMDSQMRCRGFQYKEGETYKIPEDELSICNKGFHAIDEDECPLSVFEYYPPRDENGTPNRFFEVKIGGETEKKDEKICGSEIKIGAEIDFLGLAKAHVEWVKKHIKKEGEKHETEEFSAATNTGYQSAATNTGYRSAATNTGDQSAATNTGYQSAAEVSGKESIAAVFGKDSKARGALGCWLVLTERGEWDGYSYPLIEVRSVKVDGETIKPMVWYKLENGKVKEIED